MTFANKAGHAEVYLYDEIGGWGITAKSFAQQLQALGDVNKITLHLNSPGGDVFDGAAIFNLLAKHPAEVVIEIDGMALSAASVIAMAGDTIKIAANAMVMIHDPWTIAAGSSDDMRKAAELLDKVKSTIVDVYVARTGNTSEQVVAWMKSETWLSADEAKAHKFADEVTPNKSIAAAIKPDDLRNSWESVKADPRRLHELVAELPVNENEPVVAVVEPVAKPETEQPNWRTKMARYRQRLESNRL